MKSTTIQDPLLKTAERLFKAKVTVKQLEALILLLEGKKHLNKLGERMDLTTNGATYHINLLRESGHVMREGQYVWLTPKGRTHAKSLAAKVSFERSAA